MLDRIDRIEKKLDDLVTSVARRFDDVDRRFDDVDRRFDDVDRRFDAVGAQFVAVGAAFDAVDGAFVEQRQYTEFAFGRLEGKIETLEAKMDARFDRVDRALSLFIRSPGTRKRSPRKR